MSKFSSLGLVGSDLVFSHSIIICIPSRDPPLHREKEEDMHKLKKGGLFECITHSHTQTTHTQLHSLSLYLSHTGTLNL